MQKEVRRRPSEICGPVDRTTGVGVAPVAQRSGSGATGWSAATVGGTGRTWPRSAGSDRRRVVYRHQGLRGLPSALTATSDFFAFSGVRSRSAASIGACVICLREASRIDRVVASLDDDDALGVDANPCAPARVEARAQPRDDAAWSECPAKTLSSRWTACPRSPASPSA
jgi:hypothetical protein